jgi:Phytanoyl-CoA dioxygenase (PhyH)
MRPGDVVAPRGIAEVDRLVQDSDAVAALDALVAMNRAHPSPELQVRLIELRRRAAEAHRPAGRSPWPPECDNPFPEVVGRPPEVAARELDGALLGAAVAHHGSLLVRGLFDPDAVERSRESIERASAAWGLAPDQRTGVDYLPTLTVGGMAAAQRENHAKAHTWWLADCPAAAAQVLDDLAASGVVDAIGEHFGERPLFTLQKSTLRRVQPEFRWTAWHQDGSFLGPETRAMNVWVSLTPCGGDRRAPGLEIVPRRVEEILPFGHLGAVGIDGFAVHRTAGETPVIRPEFDPGDALLFDERMIHRTFLSEDVEMMHERLAVECWFFAPSHPAEDYVSLLA